MMDLQAPIEEDLHDQVSVSMAATKQMKNNLTDESSLLLFLFSQGTR